jgi:ABC-type transport system involved in multi-copper enzyme maturation permease subunit
MVLENEEIEVDIISIEKQRAGLKRNFTQISDTITFEFKKNLKNFFLVLLIFLGVFILFLTIQELQALQGKELPVDPVIFIKDYLAMFGFMIIISTALFGGSIIAEDFQKQTGNLLFPKISKTRLLIGRVISRYTLNAICIFFYYVLIGVITFIKYDEIPIVIWGSMGWALLYTFSLFTFVTFMSSIMKSSTATIIVSILFLLIVFNLVSMILTFTGLDFEPIFILTYYEGIIAQSMAMPNPRYIYMDMQPPQAEEPIFYKNWLTPTGTAAFIGMVIYICTFLTLAYFLYKRRQSKNE